MANIQILDVSSSARAAALEDWGPVGLPLSEPACRLRGVKMSPPGQRPEVGIWECSPGRYRRQIRSAETMHVTGGEAVFTPDGGAPVTLRPGDVCFFPADTMGVWEILATLRKVYILLDAPD